MAEKTELSREEARQGHTGDHVRYILGFGIVGVVLCFLVLFLFQVI